MDRGDEDQRKNDAIMLKNIGFTETELNQWKVWLRDEEELDPNAAGPAQDFHERVKALKSKVRWKVHLLLVLSSIYFVVLLTPPMFTYLIHAIWYTNIDL